LSLLTNWSHLCMADDSPDAPTKRMALLKTFIDEFVSIEPGVGDFPATFEMGSTHTREEPPVHQVTLAASFEMAKFEVPQNLYEAVMGENPSRWKGPRNSAEMMSWTEANIFCERVTSLLREAGRLDDDEVIRLPSEAEWEYCCRAGTTSSYSFGDKATSLTDKEAKASLLDAYGWHTGNAAGNDPPVGALKPNPWGLFDLHGYLWEFTADHWHGSYADAPTDGSSRVLVSGDAQIVIRGGSWKDKHPRLRSAARKPLNINSTDAAVGFRCVKASNRSRVGVGQP